MCLLFFAFKLRKPREKTKRIRYSIKINRRLCLYLLLRVVDPQQKDQLGQKHGRRRVGMDAPGVGLETSQAGEHHDGEEESQHGEAQRGVGDQGQRLQVPLQLLLMERSREQYVGTFIEHPSGSITCKQRKLWQEASEYAGKDGI